MIHPQGAAHQATSASFHTKIEGQGFARIGELRLSSGNVQTPQLFPVACLISGTTARGGGLWKYILQADPNHSLLRRSDLPIMAQVLQFLDFPIRPHNLRKWRQDGILSRYQHDVDTALTCPALFLDSGGYKLLWNEVLDLSAFDLSVKGDQGPTNIYNLQRDLGGDIVATLDYPLPPGLPRNEAFERMKKSRANAVAAAALHQESKNYKPFLFVATHGQDPTSIECYVHNVLSVFQERRLMDVPFGLAVGSLVPLRSAHNHAEVVQLLLSVRRAVPTMLQQRLPIHTFGVTGNLIPLLSYMGVDSFDSSTYVQHARSLTYIDPVTYKGHKILEMENLVCDCRICKELNLDKLHKSLTTGINRQRDEDGHYKSKYYGDIALHNLEMDLRLLEQTREAIACQQLIELLTQHRERFPVLHEAMELMSEGDISLRRRLGRKTLSIPHIPSRKAQPNTTRSLLYNSSSFDITRNGYCPPDNKRVLLVIPCSEKKPYSTSQTHVYLQRCLREAFGKLADGLHNVTLSGLYGPVPEESEAEPPVLEYDFRLDPINSEQIEFVADRMVTYLIRHRDRYLFCAAYATSRAYRDVLQRVMIRLCEIQVNVPECERVMFHLYPARPKARRLSEFFRKTNVDQLVEALRPHLERKQKPNRKTK
jgi:tRNA-guanine family transglycosylase